MNPELSTLAQALPALSTDDDEHAARLCGWSVRVPNASAERLSPWEIAVRARPRWQVELVFELWEGAGRLDGSAGQRPYRVLCALLAERLGLVAQHGALLTGGPWLRPSQGRASERVRARAGRLAEALGDVVALVAALAQLQRRLRRRTGEQRRRGKPAACQRVENPYDLEFTHMPAA